MTAETHVTETATIEREIAERIRAERIRLRFDRVVRGLNNNLKAALAAIVPEGQSVVFTVTAPIKRPSETAAVLENLFHNGMPDGELRKAIHGNHVRIRPITGVATYMPKVIALVHNPESDPGLILAIAESRLLGRN
jgi:hypothetical protein